MQNWREWLIGLIVVFAIGGVFSFPAIPQDPAYHQFSDAKTIFGIQNFYNVVSNLAFVLVGMLGLIRYSRKQIICSKLSYLIFCTGILFVGIGSAYYHHAPTPQSLVWDRLPMTLAFMAFFSMVVGDRVSAKLGTLMLWPLLIAGVASVVYWDWTEMQGQGDLRAYALIQFLPMLLIPVMVFLYPGGLMRLKYLWGALGAYALAKVAEHFDLAIYQSLGFVSGHTIKHLLSAVAALWIIFAVGKIHHASPFYSLDNSTGR